MPKDDVNVAVLTKVLPQLANFANSGVGIHYGSKG